MLRAVREAEAALAADPAANKEYLPIAGLPEFNRLSRELALGPSHPAIRDGRVATVQALSGGWVGGRDASTNYSYGLSVFVALTVLRLPLCSLQTTTHSHSHTRTHTHTGFRFVF